MSNRPPDVIASGYPYPEKMIDEFGLADVLLSLGANIACLGGLPMTLHSDQGFAPLTTEYPLIMKPGST